VGIVVTIVFFLFGVMLCVHLIIITLFATSAAKRKEKKEEEKHTNTHLCSNVAFILCGATDTKINYKASSS